MVIIRNIGIAASHGYCHGNSRRIVETDFGWGGRIRDIYNAQAFVIIGNKGIAASHGYILGPSRRIVKADPGGRRRVGDVEDVQTSACDSDIRIASGYEDTSHRIEQDAALADNSGLYRIRDIQNRKPVSDAEVGVVALHRKATNGTAEDVHQAHMLALLLGSR